VELNVTDNETSINMFMSCWFHRVLSLVLC